MGDVIKVDFNKKQKVEKFTVKKYLCANCLKDTIHDSRKKPYDPFLSFEKNQSQGLCKECAIKVAGAVENEGW